VSLEVLGGSLCIFASTDVWIMKEYRGESSWSRLCKLPMIDFMLTSVLRGLRKGSNEEGHLEELRNSFGMT
jgi:hypothetical protein